jgi:hypothetical protein
VMCVLGFLLVPGSLAKQPARFNLLNNNALTLHLLCKCFVIKRVGVVKSLQVCFQRPARSGFLVTSVTF